MIPFIIMLSALGGIKVDSFIKILRLEMQDVLLILPLRNIVFKVRKKKKNDNILMIFTMDLEIHSDTNIQRALCR